MNITAHIHRNSRYYPDKLAIVEGNTRFNWSEFDQRTRKLAASFSGLGIKKGDRVGVLMLNGYRYMEAFYALPRLGAIIVPLNIRYSPVEVAFVLNDCEAVALLVDDKCLPLYEKFAAFLNNKGQLIFAGTENQPAPAGMLAYESLIEDSQAAGDFQEVQPDEDDTVTLLYTGGTTGKSKGVILTHRILTAGALIGATEGSITPDAVYLHIPPMFHIADVGWMVTFTMLATCHTFLPRFEPVKILELIEREQVTHIGLVPTMINLLLQVPAIQDYNLSSLRWIFSGGSATPVEVLHKLRRLLHCGVRQGYGMTEARALGSMDWQDLLTAIEAPPGSTEARHLLSCGKPGPTVEVRIVDDLGQDVAPGVIGEVIARGPTIMKGYWNLPHETVTALRDGWFHTGDLATIDEENFIYIIDRKKDMIISGGENVYSAEVENALHAHPAVSEVAVIGVPDEKWGERVHAVVVLRPGFEVSEAEIVAKCRELIAGYKIPRSLEFVPELPKSGAGKILKRTLREKYWQNGVRQVN